jgi:very-short-patch-repair endonuclease
LDYQTWLLIGFVVFLAVMALVITLITERGKPTSTASLPYEKEPYLLTQGEQAFYRVLLRSIDPDVTVFAKVRLIDLVRVRKGTDKPQAHKNRVISKHVDFVLCTREQFEPLLVIELDDSSHKSANRQARDEAKDAILAAAGIPVLRVTARSEYSELELKERITSQLGSISPVSA